MKFGIPLLWVKQEQLKDVMQAAEELGYESAWAPDHLILPARPAEGTGGHGDVPPDLPILDAGSLMSYVAAVTTTLRVGTWVYVLSARHPFVAARTFQSVDVLSGGRVEMGIGAGYVPSEFTSAGIDFDSRGRRTEESIAICRSLWRDPVTEFHGEFFDFDPVAMFPKPASNAGPRIHVGGTSTAALRRAANLAEGWMGLEGSPEELAPILDRLRAQPRGVGFPPLEITSGAGRVIGRADLPVADAAMVAEYDQLGVDRLIVRPWRKSADALSGLERFANECIAR
jgi:probable F420-dependent oxidoreductase